MSVPAAATPVKAVTLSCTTLSFGLTTDVEETEGILTLLNWGLAKELQRFSYSNGGCQGLDADLHQALVIISLRSSRCSSGRNKEL